MKTEKIIPFAFAGVFALAIFLIVSHFYGYDVTLWEPETIAVTALAWAAPMFAAYLLVRDLIKADPKRNNLNVYYLKRLRKRYRIEKRGEKYWVVDIKTGVPDGTTGFWIGFETQGDAIVFAMLCLSWDRYDLSIWHWDRKRTERQQKAKAMREFRGQ